MPFTRIIRILLAIFYDSFIVFSLLLAVTALCLFILPHHHLPKSILWFQGLLLLVPFLYFAVSLYKKGQTLGMRAWQLFITKN